MRSVVYRKPLASEDNEKYSGISVVRQYMEGNLFYSYYCMLENGRPQKGGRRKFSHKNIFEQF